MSETPQEKAEAQAIRRRWITVGELVAVAGVLIAAVSLWMNWADKRDDAAQVAAQQSAESRRATTATLVGVAREGGASVALADPAQPSVASIDVTFPRALGAASQETVVPPRIEAEWIATPLLELTDGGADSVRGRVPVMIATTITNGDSPKVDRAIYDIVFATRGRTFGGRALMLEGVVFRERVRGDAIARLDSLWAIEAKRLKATVTG